MTNELKSKPMYFASIEVENVKSFGNKQKLNLTDSKGALSPWTLIVGDNGIGKTSLLKCLAWMLPVELPDDQPSSEKLSIAKQLRDNGVGASIIKQVTGIDIEKLEKNDSPNKETELKSESGSAKVRIKPIMDNFDNEADYNSIIRVGEGMTMNIKAQLTNGLSLNSIPLDEDLITIGIRLKREGGQIQDISDTSHLTTTDLDEFNSPNLFAYGASRHIASENLEKPELKEPTFNLLSNSGDLYDAEEVLLKLYNDSLEEKIEYLESGTVIKSVDKDKDENQYLKIEGNAARYLQKVKEILTKLLPRIENPDCIIINQSNKNEGASNSKVVEIKTPFGQVGLYDLSLGYQTMLAWVVDLAIRMFWLNPESKEPLKQPAVVIVDEIDLHLHPKWQRTVKHYLTYHFPNTQFICTAHSPFVAQASDDANLCVLHEIKLSQSMSEVHIENDPTVVKNWHIGQVVTNLFELPEFGQETEESLIQRRRHLLDKQIRTPDEDKEIKELNEQIINLPVYETDADKKLLDQIRKTAEALRQNGGLNDKN